MTRSRSLPVLDDGVARLRAFRDADAPVVQSASADPLIPLITTVPTEPSEAAALAFIARQHERLETEEGYSFAIADAATDEAVGQIGMWPRAVDPQRASLGYWVEQSFRGGGHAASALRQLADWAFADGAMARLELAVEPWNEASWRIAERAGFEREGLMREWQPVGGVRKDMYLYARLRSN